MPTSPFTIQPLTELNLGEVLPVAAGYESFEKYAVEKTETEQEIVFFIRLISLAEAHRNTFTDDFNEEDAERYRTFLPQGYSFGAYQDGRLVALAISEINRWNRSLRIWEFQVHPDYRRRGIGRALMLHVLDKARQGGLRIAYLETQNTNVPAIRFYRSTGFSLDALDLSFYTNHDVESGEVAFFMKQKLE